MHGRNRQISEHEAQKNSDPRERRKFRFISWQSRVFQYFLGLFCGITPLVLLIIAFPMMLLSAMMPMSPSLYSYVYFTILAIGIILLFFRATRFVGYGVLTMWLAAPVIANIACMVMIRNSCYHSCR
jgi:hypothetical protein